MAKQIQLIATARTETGKAPAKRMRSSGMIPAVIYGTQKDPLSLSVPAKAFGMAMQHGSSENVLVDLKVDQAGQTENRLALIQEVQHHPVSDEILHIDFHEVSATETLRTDVPVRAVGEPIGVKNSGGILEYVMRELRVECLPQDLPEAILVNVEALDLEDTIHVREITPPTGVTLLDDAEQAVFLVAAPITEEEEAALGAAPAAGEPEVIGEKKEEGEAAPAKAEEGKAEGKPAAGKGEAKAAPKK